LLRGIAQPLNTSVQKISKLSVAMPSKLVWKAVDIFSIAHRHIGRCPIEWDQKRKRFVYHKKWKDVIWYNFNAAVIGFGLFSLMFVLKMKFTNAKEDLPNATLLIYCLVLVYGLIVYLIIGAVKIKGELHVKTINQLLSYCPILTQGKILP